MSVKGLERIVYFNPVDLDLLKTVRNELPRLFNAEVFAVSWQDGLAALRECSPISRGLLWMGGMDFRDYPLFMGDLFGRSEHAFVNLYNVVVVESHFSPDRYRRGLGHYAWEINKKDIAEVAGNSNINATRLSTVQVYPVLDSHKVRCADIVSYLGAFF